MEELAPLRAAAEFSFEFREPLRAPNPLLTLDHAAIGYRNTEEGTEKQIASGINFSLQTGQRIGLLGVNGAGKSTFIKTIAGELAVLHGESQLGKGLVIGYFAQHQLEMLRHDESPLWHLARIAPTTREQELRNFLGSFNFPGDMVTSSIAPFSGGEKARLALALIVWQRPNLLLLDEPTNHLDLETREALTDALAQFEGTLVLVSHDRHLLRATTDQFLIVANGALSPFDGDLDDYRDWLFKTKLDSKTEARNASLPDTKNIAKLEKKAPAPIIESISPAERKEQKKLEAEQRQKIAALRKPIETSIKRLEEKIEKLNLKKKNIESILSESDIYEEHRKSELQSLLSDQAYCSKELAEVEETWMSQQEDLERLSQ
jgi:ATP-binding cassette subfamily F protein 3